MNEDLISHTKKMVALVKSIFRENLSLVNEVGTTNLHGDKTIGMDLKIEEEIIKYIKTAELPFQIFSEEAGVQQLHADPKFLITLDPLDGSTNYKFGKNLLPFGTLITIYSNLHPKINDVIVAGVFEATHSLGWIYANERTIDLEGKPVKLEDSWPINMSTPFYANTFYKEEFELYRTLVSRVFIRNTGSIIGNLSYLLSNAISGIGGPFVKAEEIGAITALVKGAGGIVVDHSGNDLGEKEFNHENSYQLIAGPKSIVNFVQSILKESSS